MNGSDDYWQRNWYRWLGQETYASNAARLAQQMGQEQKDSEAALIRAMGMRNVAPLYSASPPPESKFPDPNGPAYRARPVREVARKPWWRFW